MTYYTKVNNEKNCVDVPCVSKFILRPCLQAGRVTLLLGLP